MAEQTAEIDAVDAPPVTTGFEAAYLKALHTDTDTGIDTRIKPDAEKQPPQKQPVVTPTPAAKEDRNPVIPTELVKKPDAVPVEKKDEKPVVSEIDAIPDYTGKNEGEKSNFKKLREKAQEYEKQAKELRAELDGIKPKLTDSDTLQKRIVDLEKERDGYLDIVSKTRVENHPEFQKEFVEGRNNLIKRAQSIMTESGADADAIKTALNLRGKDRVDAIREATGEMDGLQLGRLGRVIDELSTLDERADAKITDSRKTWDEIQTGEKAKADASQAEFAQKVKTSFDSTASRLKGDFEVLNHVEGNAEWNAKADAIISDSRKFAESNRDINVAMEKAIMAHMAPVYREAYLDEAKYSATVLKRAEAAEAELAGIYKASPSLKNGEGNNGGGEKATSNMSFVDRFKHEMATE